MNALIEV